MADRDVRRLLNQAINLLNNPSQAPQDQAQIPQAQVPQVQVPQAQVPQVQVPQAQAPQAQAPQAQAPASNQVPAQTTRVERATQNFRQSFPSLAGVRYSPYRSTTSSTSKATTNRRSSGARFIPSQTWTHDVIVLSKRNASFTPTRNELDELKLGGLGKKRVVFNKNGNHDYFIKKLEDEYPKLITQKGAIEVLRATSGGAGAKAMVSIPLPSGYDVPSIKDSIGSAVLYVRPIQTDLPLDRDNTMSSQSPTVTCIHCSLMVPLHQLKEHQNSINCVFAVAGSSTSASTSQDSSCSSTIKSSISSISSSSNVQDSSSKSSSSYIQGSSSTSIADTPTGSEAQTSDPLVFIEESVNSSASAPNNSATITHLQEMFPNVPLKTIKEITDRSLTVDSAVESLTLYNDDPKDECISSLPELIDSYQSQVTDDEFQVTVERENVWVSVLKIYKSCISNIHNLKKKLFVVFKDEDGLDAGAVSREFFHLALQQIKKRLFIGEENRAIPIKDFTKLFLFQVAGMIIAHSIIQKGPTFSCLSPSTYYYIIGRSEDVSVNLVKTDIPLTAATCKLHTLIDALDECNTEESLEKILDDDANMHIISSAHWPVEVMITLKNKAALVSTLIQHELVSGRQQELDELAKGLENMGLLSYLKLYPTLGKDLLCFNESQVFGPEEFQRCVNLQAPDSYEFEKTQAFGWFKEYISEDPDDASYPAGSRLKTLLQFCTGFQVPPAGSEKSCQIDISYLPDDEEYQLPLAQACMGLLRLPVVHSSQAKFIQMMDVALKCESTGFGAV